MARVAKTASEDLFALHLRGDCRRFTAIQQVVQSVYSLSKLFSGIALHGSKLTRGAQKIDSGCVQWDGEGFPELGCVLIPSHRPPPSITVVCGPHNPVIFWLFVAYDINLGFVVLAWGDLSSHPRRQTLANGGVPQRMDETYLAERIATARSRMKNSDGPRTERY